MSAQELDFRQYDRLSPGAQAFNRYEVLRCLGKGATSVVYSCRDICDGSTVALKVLSVEAASNEKIVEKFRNEIHACYHIRHQNVVRILQFFRRGGCEAFTMEYVEGSSLGEILDSGDFLEFPEILSLLMQICSGLQAVHSAGVVHRDLKPDNVLTTIDGVAKICDFNTALCRDRHRTDTDHGQIGTLEYMSPEVLMTGHADERSDIFSMGVLAYQLTTGSLPFEAQNSSAHIKQKAKGKYPGPAKRRKDCPEDLQSIIRSMLKSNPDERPQSADDLQSLLQQLDIRPKPRSLLQRLGF